MSVRRSVRLLAAITVVIGLAGGFGRGVALAGSSCSNPPCLNFGQSPVSGASAQLTPGATNFLGGFLSSSDFNNFMNVLMNVHDARACASDIAVIGESEGYDVPPGTASDCQGALDNIVNMINAYITKPVQVSGRGHR